MSTRITIREHEGWKIELVECEHPYPVLSYNDIPVSPLISLWIPKEIQAKFWKVLEEYNIFLEVEEDGCEEATTM